MLIATTALSAQNISTDSVRIQNIGEQLTALSERDPAFQNEVDLSIGRITMAEIVRHVASVGGVNLVVKGGEGVQVSCNFTRVKIVDLLYFLCREYNFDITIIGNIVSVFPVMPPPPPPKELLIEYDTLTHTLSYNLLNEPLAIVTQKITLLTGINIVLPQSYYTKMVSGFVQSLPIENAIELLAQMNNLEIEQSTTTDGVWSIVDNSAVGANNRRKPTYAPNDLFIDSLGLITARISGNMSEIITELCERQRLNYYFISPINGDIAVYLREVDFDTLLDIMMSGTQNSYYKEGGIYIFGAAQGQSKMTSVQVVRMNNRAVTKIAEAIPDALKSGVQVYTFADMNSLILSGDQKQVARVENFVRSIDERVPMITIEVMMVDVKHTDIREMGLGFGVGKSPAEASTGSLSQGGLAIDLDAQSVNSLINSFNGFGHINLGKVSDNFYLNLKALEDRGQIELNSTPKLSTLNGQEAVLKSGETQYYKEITNNYIGYQNPTMTENYIWKSIDANMSLKITPYVSEDNTITLEIEIEQTEFMAREDPTAPPGTTTRSFKSIVKVAPEEVVLLGGIDRHSVENSSRGLPWIARIPVLRWLFGYTKRNKVEHKLNVFIKTSIVE